MNEMNAGRAGKPITQEEIALWRLISVSDLQRILDALATGTPAVWRAGRWRRGHKWSGSRATAGPAWRVELTRTAG